jgi:hypothetical protein
MKGLFPTLFHPFRLLDNTADCAHSLWIPVYNKRPRERIRHLDNFAIRQVSNLAMGQTTNYRDHQNGTTRT